MLKSALAALLFACCANAQIHSTVAASGQASIFVPPDQAKIDITITASGPTASAASTKDATQVTAVLGALTKLLGAGANVKTVNYFVGPVYNNSGATITSYSASSTLEVTLTNLSLAGTVIDTAIGAGATSVGDVQFSLQNSDPAHNQALAAATVQAMAHASAMATALGRAVGMVLSVQEVTATPALIGVLTGSSPVTSTTIVPGLLQVQVSVTLQAELN
ncbi:MAG TPA: SIMPL domain-containing protein [Bryobacteraceae bacterium]|jgi:hypothetical protein